MAKTKKEERFIIISGPSRDDLMTIFRLQHKEYLLDPPFATIWVKKTYNHRNTKKGATLEIDLAFYPTKIEYLNDSGQSLSIAGYIACISTDTGRRISLSQIYTIGRYDADSRVGFFDVDLEAFQESNFKKQFDEELQKQIDRKNPPKSEKHT